MYENKPLYANLLKESYDDLPPSLQLLHNLNSGDFQEYYGNCNVVGGKNFIAKLIAKIMKLPKSQYNAPLLVKFKTVKNTEHWMRYFDNQPFYSTQMQKGDLLYEKISFITLAFQVSTDQKAIYLNLKQLYFFKLPILKLCRIKIISKEWEQNGQFNFFVKISAPFIGTIIQYQGYLNVQ